MVMFKCMRPETVVSDDNHRPDITECYVREGAIDDVEPLAKCRPDERDGVIIATDGVMMVVCAVVLERGDKEGYVDPNVLRLARRDAPTSRMMHVGLPRDEALINGSFRMPRTKGGRERTFPGFEAVIQEAKPGTTGISAFNPARMVRLAQAMGFYDAQEKGVWTCLGPGDGKPALCRIRNCEHGRHALGVIMPMRLREGGQ